MTSWEPPGPGTWDLDRSHYDAAATRLSTELMTEGTEAAYRKLFARLGVPASGIEMRAVNGFYYTRVRPYFGADSASTKTPPDWVVKTIFRVHPEMRRREARAAEALETDESPAVIADWEQRIKPALVAKNRRFQDTDLGGLDDDALAAHVDSLTAHCRETFEEHHRLHGYDLGPIASYAVACTEWGIPVPEALAGLTGASPSTTEPRRQLAEIRAEIEAQGASPDSLDDLRAVSSRAAKLLDDYLGRHGAVVFSSYDIDSPTLGERPDLILSTIMHATVPVESDASADGDRRLAALRARLDQSDHAEFDRLVTSARNAMDMRDDNGPITVEWPVGLLRLGMLEAGRRLADSGRIHDVDHIFELERAELRPLIAEGEGPSADQLRDRREHRDAQRELDPPEQLGPPAEDPPLHLMPPAMARTLKMIGAATEALGMTAGEARPSLTGDGIGTESFTGIARIGATAEEAFDRLNPGEILVTRATSPAFNLVLSLAGGLITVDGGPMAHAAVLSRELGLPAVIGVSDCLDHIVDGDLVEIDPVRGVVTIVESD